MAIAALYTYSPARLPSKPFPSPSSLECLPDDLRGKREEQLGESLSSQPHRVSKFFLKKEEQNSLNACSDEPTFNDLIVDSGFGGVECAESLVDQNSVLILLLPTRVLSRLLALRIGIIAPETALWEH
jgi:hypothetical protein